MIHQTQSRAARLPQIVLAVVAFIAAASVALGSPAPASAHGTDPYRQHGWSWGGPEIRCFPRQQNGDGYITMYYLPNVMTTPVRTQYAWEYVWFLAKLEWAYTNSNTWGDVHPTYFSPTWYRSQANNSGLLVGWWNYSASLWASGSIFSQWIPAGFKYRFRLSFYWYDGERHDYVTSACTV